MGKIEINGSGFTHLYTKLNGASTITVSKVDLIHAAITYGYKNWFDVKFSEAARRVITVLSALEENKLNSYYEQTNLYKHGDASEKTYTSYVIGMTISKIIASKILGFNWLMHYDMFVRLPGVVCTRSSTSNEKPDFISIKNTNDWLVMEAKGRSGGFDSNPITKGKQQVNTVLSINGKTPLRVVSESYFATNLNVDYVDPETEEGDIFNTEDNNIQKYYFEILQVLFNSIEEVKKPVTIKNYTFSGSIISGTEFYVGIPVEIFNFVENSNQLSKFIGEIKEKLHDQPGVFIGDDGILIIDRTQT